MVKSMEVLKQAEKRIVESKTRNTKFLSVFKLKFVWQNNIFND